MKKLWICLAFTVEAAGMACKKNGGPGQSTPDLPPSEKKVVVTTIAGEGTNDFEDGPALQAKFYFPEDVAVSPDGTLFVTDNVNHRIRRVASGQVYTHAGDGKSGILNDIAMNAEFRNPFSIALDGKGTLYMTDENDPRIRIILANGNVTTLAGTEGEGFADGRADTARFQDGSSLVADEEGNLFVADTKNHRIRKISASGEVSTLAGTAFAGFRNGSAGDAQFSSPGGIARDAEGNLYVADRGNYCIRKITPGGEVSTFSGSGIPGFEDGDATQARFSIEMRDLVADSKGNLFITDDNRIRRISSNGAVLTLAGTTQGYKDGLGPEAQFNYPAGLGVDTQGNIYVADLNNHRIRKISWE